MIKPPFVVILGQKGQFWKFLAKMAKTVKIIKKAVGKFFSRLHALTKCKVSEKSNVCKKSLREKSVTYGRTHGSTDATPKVSTTSWSRDQK